MADSQTTFSSAYVISVIMALGASYFVNLDIAGGSSTTSVLIKFFVVPIVVAFTSLMFLNMLFPAANRGGRVMNEYVNDTIADRINNMNYMQVFPPIFIVFIMFMVMAFK